MRTPVARTALLSVALLALVACGSGDALTSAPSGTGSVVDGASPTPSPERSTAPLTGVRTDDPDVAERPVVAVKIENTAAARPQAGLDSADVVFEELVEGGITRFIALFQSRVPTLVGPVRSGRPEDAQVLPAYDPMLFISGARDDVLRDLSAAGVEYHAEDGRVLYRDRGRSAPHNVFAAGPGLFQLALGEVPPARPVGWSFDPGAPDGAVDCTEPCEDPGTRISVPMSRQSVTGFEYDAGAGVYRRTQDGAPQVVAGSGRVGAANVLVLATESRQEGCCDPAGNPLNETAIVGRGSAVMLRDGLRYEGRWVKSSPDEHIQVLGPDGRPFAFKPGPTWVLFAPAGNVPTVAASPASG